MQWAKVTDIILFTAILVLLVFVGFGLYQWATRRSLAKVDKALLGFIPPLLIMAATYFIFDKLLILNVRPDGSGDPSFPSSHVMVVATIFFITMLALPKYLKQKSLIVILDALMLLMVTLVSVGRVLANMHWVSDVVAGLIFAAIFTVIYYLITKTRSSHE